MYVGCFVTAIVQKPNLELKVVKDVEVKQYNPLGADHDHSPSGRKSTPASPTSPSASSEYLAVISAY